MIENHPSTDKPKRVLLIDVDSTIPNVALMKISGYHKMKGDIVGFDVEDPDLVYASVIFTQNKHKVDGLQFLYPKAKINIGGSGYDLKRKLPVDMEYLSPTDYSIYPDCDSYYGFTSRGCIRNCAFCVVPKKEGRFKRERSIPCLILNDKKDVYQNLHKASKPNLLGVPEGGFQNLTLLDNNIIADKEWFIERTNEILEYCPNMRVDFNQGLDIRLVDSEIAERLGQLKPINVWKFAFDSISYRDKVLDGLDILANAGISTKNRTMFYVYMDGDHDFGSALERCNLLRGDDRGQGCNRAGAFVMINLDAKRTQRMTDLKRWCIPWIFWSVPFDRYNSTEASQVGRLDDFMGAES